MQQKLLTKIYPLNIFFPTQATTRGFESKFMSSGLKSKIKVPSKAGVQTFSSTRWRIASFSQVPFYFNRLFNAGWDLPKKLSRSLQISQFANVDGRLKIGSEQSNVVKFHSVVQVFKLATFFTNSYVLSLNRELPTNFKQNRRALSIVGSVQRDRAFLSKARGAQSSSTISILKRRKLARLTSRTRTSLWLNHLYAWSFLLSFYKGFGFSANSELRSDSVVQDKLKTERFGEHLQAHPSGLVRPWVNNATLETPLLANTSDRLYFLLSTLRSRVLRSRAIHARYIESYQTFKNRSWFGWERLKTTRQVPASSLKAGRFSVQNMMVAARRLRLKLRRHKSYWFKRINYFRKTLLIRKYWRSVWLIKRRFQLKNFLINKFTKYCAFKLQRLTNIYVLRVDLLLCKLFRVANLRFSRQLILKNHVRINGKLVWNFAETLRRFDVLTISRRAKGWISVMRRLRLRRVRALRSMARSSIRPHIRKALASRRVTAKRRTMSAAFIVNPFGAILCSPKRAKLKKCLSRSFARIYKSQCTYLYRTIFR